MRSALLIGAAAVGLLGPVTGAPAGRVEGPFGRGAGQVWLVVPSGPIRSIVVFGHGWKVAPPSASYSWVGQFRPWLDHLTAAGSAVLFPRYQLGVNDVPGLARLAAYRRGLEVGFRRLNVHRVPVIAEGYSYGASLALTYAAEGPAWRLPRPAAVDAVFPAGMIPGAPMPRLADSVRVLIQVGDRDTIAGARGAVQFWSWLRSHPRSHKRYQIVRSSGTFVATHAAPKLRTSAARRAFWAPLDSLIASVRRAPRASGARRADGFAPGCLALALFRMELSGACSNPRVQLELPRLGVLRSGLLRKAATAPRRPRAAPARRDRVLETVTLVLERADRPMRAREIHRAAEQLLGRSLRWASVRGVLSAYTIGADRRFRRVRRGLYETRSPS